MTVTKEGEYFRPASRVLRPVRLQSIQYLQDRRMPGVIMLYIYIYITIIIIIIVIVIIIVIIIVIVIIIIVVIVVIVIIITFLHIELCVYSI